MRQSTSSQEGGVIPGGLTSQQSLPYGRQPSADSGQPQCIIDRVDHLDRQIQRGSNESLPGKQNGGHTTTTANTTPPASTKTTAPALTTSTTTTTNTTTKNGMLSKTHSKHNKQKSMEEITIIGNGGGTIARSDSFTETLPLTVALNTRPRITRQKSGSCDNLDDTHSKLSSQTSSEGRPRSGSFAGSLEGTKEADDTSSTVGGSSWTSQLLRKHGRDSTDKEFPAGRLLHTSRTKSRDSHDSHSDATTLSRRESIEDMPQIPIK